MIRQLALYSFPDWKSANYDGGLARIGYRGGSGAAQHRSHGTWNGCYSALRNINILLEKAAGYSDQDAIASSIGTAYYFFRAWQHFNLPRLLEVCLLLTMCSTPMTGTLRRTQQSLQVMNLIIEDLKKAVELLPKRSTMQGLEQRGRLTKEGAQGFSLPAWLFTRQPGRNTFPPSDMTLTATVRQ